MFQKNTFVVLVFTGIFKAKNDHKLAEIRLKEDLLRSKTLPLPTLLSPKV
jgi:hypothetical protein